MGTVNLFPACIYYSDCFIVLTEPPPDAPMLTLGDVSSTFVIFSWDQQLKVDTYTIEYHRLGGFKSRQTECGLIDHENFTSLAGNVAEYNLTGLQEDSNYSITITAMNMGGSSSSMLEVTTLQAGM